jgi:hypothetical protein
VKIFISFTDNPKKINFEHYSIGLLNNRPKPNKGLHLVQKFCFVTLTPAFPSRPIAVWDCKSKATFSLGKQ